MEKSSTVELAGYPAVRANPSELRNLSLLQPDPNANARAPSASPYGSGDSSDLAAPALRNGPDSIETAGAALAAEPMPRAAALRRWRLEAGGPCGVRRAPDGLRSRESRGFVAP